MNAHSPVRKPRERSTGQKPRRRAEDPVLRRIREWDEANLALAAKQAELLSRWDRVPRRIREWKGVYLGHGVGFEGEPIPLRVRDAGLVEEVFGKRLAQARTEGETLRLAGQRARALDELHEMRQAERIALEAAELPFDPDGEAAFWEPYLSRIEAAASAVAETRAASLNGLFAKLALAARLTREAQAENPDGEPAGFALAHRLVLSAADDAERLKPR